MRPNQVIRSLALTALVPLVAVTLACGQKTPEEKLAETRALYRATLNGFLIKSELVLDDPLPGAVEGEAVEEEAGEAEGEAPPEESELADADGDGIEEEDLIEPPMRQDAHLDILIQHNSSEKLDGITLDISMVDGQKTEKAHWRVWFDTSDVVKATGRQFTYILEDVDYVEGDGFGVEVRHPVPVEERGEYQEFAALP